MKVLNIELNNRDKSSQLRHQLWVVMVMAGLGRKPPGVCGCYFTVYLASDVEIFFRHAKALKVGKIFNIWKV